MRRLAAACALAFALPACSGGGSAPAPGAPGPVPTPTPVPTSSPAPPVDSTARAAAQSALLAQQAAMVLLATPGGPSFLSRRRTAASRTPRATVPCTGGFAEQDSSLGGGTTHAVISLYFDAACTQLRQRATLDRTMGVDTGQTTGTIDSFDRAGRVSASQAVTESFGLVTGTVRTVVDSQPGATPTSPATVLGRSALSCPFAGTGTSCSLAAIADGPSFESGVVLTATNITGILVGAGATATVPFNGALATGVPGSMTIVQQPPQPPLLTGGSFVTPFNGSLTITPGANGPAAFSLTADTATIHVTATFANGTTTIAVTGGITATVNLNGDGTISYPNGTSGTVLDFRIVG